jgi:hypothetical protein
LPTTEPPLAAPCLADIVNTATNNSAGIHAAGPSLLEDLAMDSELYDRAEAIQQRLVQLRDSL